MLKAEWVLKDSTAWTAKSDAQESLVQGVWMGLRDRAANLAQWVLLVLRVVLGLQVQRESVEILVHVAFLESLALLDPPDYPDSQDLRVCKGLLDLQVSMESAVSSALLESLDPSETKDPLDISATLGLSELWVLWVMQGLEDLKAALAPEG